MRATNNYVDIPFTNENDDVEFYDEDEINEMHYDDEPPTNKVSSDDGEHIMPSPMFKQLNWDAINSMTAEPLTPRTGLWNESNELFKGLRFESKEDLQYAVKRYAICRNQHLVVCESEPQLWAVRCKKWQEGCNWRLRACRRKSHGMFEITKYAGPHTCVYPKLSQDHSQLDSTLIAREIQNVVQRDHTTSIATLHQIVKDKFGYDVHYRRIWEAKRKAMLRVFGDWDESYQALSKWMNILQLTNLEQRHHVTQREGICLISDRHAGINAAVRNPSVGWSPPHAQHRYCLRHVVSNFNDKFKNKVLKELAYRAGCQHQPWKYERYMEELKRLDEKSVAWFSKLDTQKWTQAYDLGYRYGWMTTNIAECINGVLKGARMLPITALVQLTFYRCVSYFETRRAEIRARMVVGDVYTAYAIEKFRRARPKLVDTLSPFSIEFMKHLKLDAYASCYAPEFNLIPHKSYWSYPDFPILHPDPTSMRDKGRPRSSRIRNEMDLKEPSVRIRCGLCITARWSRDPWIRQFYMDRPHTGHLQHGQVLTRRSFIVDDVRRSSIAPVTRWTYYSFVAAGRLLWTHSGDTDIDGQRLHLTWLSQSFPTLAPDADEESISVILGLISYSSLEGSACLAWLYRQLCRASHIDTHDISSPLILLQLWVWERFPFIAPHRLHIAPHDDQLPPPPLAIRWRDEFRTISISMHVLLSIGTILIDLQQIRPDRVLRQFGFRQGIPQPCDNESILHKCDLRGRHDVDWTTRHGDYIRRWSSRREHIARGEMAIGSLGYHDPYMVWYRSITIRFLTRTGSFHELLTTSIHQIYDIAPPDDFRIRRLCTTVLEAIHEMDRLDAPFSVDATTQLQPPSGDVRPTRRGPRTREIRHTPAVARVRPLTDISPPPHQQPTSSITRSGGVRTRGGGPHTRSSPPPHQQAISSITRSGGVRTRGGRPHTRSSPPPHQQPISPITRSGGVRTRGGGPHTRSSPPPHQQPISPITRSGGVRTRGRGAHMRGTRHTSVLRDAPSTDISLPPVQETPITPMEVPSTPPVVPLVASSPPSIEATLVHEELVHIANDDQQGQKTNRGRGHGRGRGRRRGRGAHGGLHVSPIEPLVEHAHHRRPLRKRKAPSCGTH
ncbi:Serine/threonine-protein phosphatase 7 long form-like [Vitis vinifera]|uniref:Serine/threonine-protein phosphatase 7 long form-like n=1 Tax=Vitis vinifera TaxID=29760 RepID=A0A438J1F4_VITVI|nr:Serine/threonine-protein phosphatase 7 long form-like [Vitis vinifera]